MLMLTWTEAGCCEPLGAGRIYEPTAMFSLPRSHTYMTWIHHRQMNDDLILRKSMEIHTGVLVPSDPWMKILTFLMTTNSALGTVSCL